MPEIDTTSGPPATVCYRHRDRETLVSCSNCERPICPSCMTQAAVGVRCPECSGKAVGVRKLRPRQLPRGTAYVTMTLVAVNVLAFVVQSAQAPGSVGRGLGGQLAERGALIGLDVAAGEWWRIVTSGFLHGGLIHIAFNMIALWLLGTAFEAYAGPLRMAIVYFTSLLWGSAGALLMTDARTATVGASGGVFGLMAAILVLERQRGVGLLGGSIGPTLALNLVITFALPGISIGGHLGGILGGAAAGFVLSSFGRGHMASRRVSPPVVGAVAVLMAAAVIVGLLGADWRTKRFEDQFPGVTGAAITQVATFADQPGTGISSCACSMRPATRAIAASTSEGWQASTLVWT